MILDFDKDLSNLSIYANGMELSQYLGKDRDDKGRRITHPDTESMLVATFDDPVLVTDNYRIAQLGEKDTTLRDTLFALYGSPIKRIVYDGTTIDFAQRKHPTVWGPSIDTLLFCRGLGKLDLKGIKTAVEIGSGSGFISGYALGKCPDLEEMTLVDFNPDAIACAKEWITDDRAKFHAGDGVKFMDHQRFDLIMCNPPYIPRPSSIDDNPYEGVGLLVDLVDRARDHLTPNGVFVTNISSLCRRIADKSIARAIASRKIVAASVIDELEVPLKVYNVLNNREWMEYLTQQKGLIAQPHDGYDFWHTISITKIE
jgi:release factor glutamine methyltransferase